METNELQIGDWVVLTAGELSTTLQIVNVDINKKLYWFNDDSYLPIVDEECLHLWTIQDAKDGDVLATEDWLFIFEKMKSNGKPTCYCHYDIELGFRIDNNSYIATGSKIYPATKEQRDLLFQKMKEAGYEWDIEKKELKKIEPKKLDADEMIKWIRKHWPFSWGNFSFPVDEAIDLFKKDFGL